MIAFVFGGLAGGAIGVVSTSGGDAAASDTTSHESVPADSVPASAPTFEAPVPPPAPEDFSVTVTKTEQACFGSAGCNVTYTVTPHYDGTYTGTGRFRVIYEVTGMDSGPYIGNFTADFATGMFEYTRTQHTSTSSPSTELTATVTAVMPAN